MRRTVSHDNAGGMGAFGEVVFDCRHPASLARFWAAALDGDQVARYDDVELARLRAMGINDPEGYDAVTANGCVARGDGLE